MVESAEKEIVPKPERPVGIRHLIAFLLFLGTTTSYATRVSMSLGIVAMTNPNDYGHPVRGPRGRSSSELDDGSSGAAAQLMLVGHRIYEELASEFHLRDVGFHINIDRSAGNAIS
ncbi:hypothetical protein evm_011375 [Chilo suppressalis]|nr:hypothetical protein evm_011375 [Chilo suppressalis]